MSGDQTTDLEFDDKSETVHCHKSSQAICCWQADQHDVLKGLLNTWSCWKSKGVTKWNNCTEVQVQRLSGLQLQSLDPEAVSASKIFAAQILLHQQMIKRGWLPRCLWHLWGFMFFIKPSFCVCFLDCQCCMQATKSACRMSYWREMQKRIVDTSPSGALASMTSDILLTAFGTQKMWVQNMHLQAMIVPRRKKASIHQQMPNGFLLSLWPCVSQQPNLPEMHLVLLAQ